MLVRVFYEGEHFIDYEDVETFYFHKEFLCLEQVDGATVFVNTNKLTNFTVNPIE
jgi:hypothetical protein